jgi:Na+/glutamate symporter
MLVFPLLLLSNLTSNATLEKLNPNARPNPSPKPNPHPRPNLIIPDLTRNLSPNNMFKNNTCLAAQICLFWIETYSIIVFLVQFEQVHIWFQLPLFVQCMLLAVIQMVSFCPALCSPYFVTDALCSCCMILFSFVYFNQSFGSRRSWQDGAPCSLAFKND